MTNNKLNILLPTDFSDNAWNAIIYALKLYADEYCTFYLLHSTHLTSSESRTLISKHYIEKLKEDALLELSELKAQAEITNANANHDFEILLTEDKLQMAVADAIKQNSIDFVVMATKGATNSMEYLMGSHTLKVIKSNKKCPTLIIPDSHEFVVPNQIAFPTDYNRFYERQELRPLLKIADINNSKIRVVHINVEKSLSNIQEYNMTMLKSYLEDNEYSLHWLPNYAKKTEAITAFIEDLNIEMLAIITYKHNLFETIINEPVVKNLVLHPKVPMLIIPD